MDSKDTLDNIQARWEHSVTKIKPTDWEHIFGRSNIKSYRFFQATEDADFEKITYHYLSVSNYGVTVAIIPCFTYYLDLTDLLTDKVSKYIIRKIRYSNKKFGKFKLLVVGSYPATCEHFIGIDNKQESCVKERVSTLINKELERKRKEQKCNLIMVKDVRTKHLDEINKVLSDDFHFFSSFPTTFVPIEKMTAYPSALNKKQRKRYRKYQNLFEGSFQWEIINDFKDKTSLVYATYLKTLNKAKNKFEILNEKFFKNINTYFPEESYLLVAKDKEGEIQIIELVLKETDRLLPLYLGSNKSEDNDATLTLYLNALFEPIKQAEKLKLDLVESGQTSYYPKVLSGALVEDLSYGFYSHHPVMKRVIEHLFKYIFTPKKVPQHAYSRIHLDKIKKVAEQKGMEVINF